MLTNPRIHNDFETRSLIDLRKLGHDVYARHWSTSPIMLAIILKGPFGYEHEEVIDFLASVPGYQQSIYPFAKPGDLNFRMIKPPCPPIIIKACAEGWVFVAHNASFEKAIWYHICHKLWGWPMPANWSCTAARARYHGLRASLGGVASDLEVINQKETEVGDSFIKTFCKPRKWVKGGAAGGVVKQLWAEPQELPEQWQKGLHYCLVDAKAECDVDAILPDLPPFEQAVYDLDFKINTRGTPIDLVSVERAVTFSEHFTQVNFKRFDEVTNLRPTQRDKVLEYINQREEIDEKGKLDNLKSKTLKRLVMADFPPDLVDIIQIRLETSKASIRKLDMMRLVTNDDGFARGGHLYFGAHTGRWSHKRIQTGNMTRPDKKKPQPYMFEYLEHPCWEENPLKGHNGPPPDEMPQQPDWLIEAGLRFIRPLSYLSTSMRGFIKAPKGKKLVVGDYSQIEARVLVWLARCMWVLEAFRNGDDVYTRFAADHMYPTQMGSYDNAVIINKFGKAEVKPEFTVYRQEAKSAQLGCGYQVSGKGFVEYCDNIDLILSLDKANEIVKKYRGAHPEIADTTFGLWTRMERAAIQAVQNEGYTIELGQTNIKFYVWRLDSERWWLVVDLGTGHKIHYYRPKVRMGLKWGKPKEILSFRTEWNGKSYREDTYGGKITENVVQAFARDVCAMGALNAEAAGYPVIMLVHDEVVTLPDEDFGSHQHLCELMCQLPPEVITDLPVEADGNTMIRYGKG